MNRLYLLLLAVLLTACAGGSPPINPYQVRADGQAAVQWADASIQGTARAEEVLGNLTASRGTQISQEVWGTASALDHQATQSAIQLTREAPAIAVQMAQLTVYAEATAAYATQTPAAATAAAIVRKAREEELQVERDHLWGRVGAFSVGFIAFCFGLAVYFGINRLVRWWIQRQWIKDTRQGVFRWDPRYETWIAILHVPGNHQLEDDDLVIDALTPAPILSRNGVVSISPTNRAEHARARELVRTAIQINGPNSNRIPSWQEMKKVGKSWTSDKWQLAKNYLERAQAVFAEPGRGTWVAGKYETLDGLRYALDHEMLKLSPTPTEDDT